MTAEGVAVSVVLMVLASTLGWVFGRRGFHSIERELAVLAPTLAAIKVGIDSVAVGLRGHIESPGHGATTTDLRALSVALDGLRRDVERIDNTIERHIDNRFLHRNRERRDGNE